MHHNLTHPIPQDLEEADEILNAYGRWAQDRYKKMHCGSAEGRYRAPPNDDDREPKVPMPADFRAMQAQRALQAVPDAYRVVLHILYVPKRLPAEAQLRLLRLPHKLCADRHLAGLRMFWNRYRVASLAEPYSRRTEAGR